MRVFICAVLLIVVVFAAPHGKLDCEFADEKESCDLFEGCEWVADENWHDEGECHTKFPVIDLDQDMPCTEEGYIQTKPDGCHFAADRSNSKFQLIDTSSLTEAGRQMFVIPFGCSVSKATYYWRPADSASASYDRWEKANENGWKRVCQGNYPDDYCTRFKDCGSCRAFAGNDDFWYRCTYSIERGCAFEHVPGLTYPRHCPASEKAVGRCKSMTCKMRCAKPTRPPAGCNCSACGAAQVEAKVGECSDTVTDTGATCADMKGWFTPHECDYDYFMNDGPCACMCPQEAKVGECSDTVTDTGATCADMKGWFTPHECDYDYFMNDGPCACMCPQAAAVGGNAQLKRINKALLEALKTMAN